mmetsp:Transcript_45259/g.147201  ORF Transcript_45259/g.147201 Transcript_45259/m.147201 type:complete len:246 (+) Transcript_45259:277-1014(+)
MPLEASLARRRRGPSRSEGSPSRLFGMRLMNSRPAGESKNSELISVRMYPGCMLLTRMPWRIHSFARARVMWSSAALDIAYVARLLTTLSEMSDAMLTIEPGLFSATIRRATACARKKGARVLTPSTVSYAASSTWRAFSSSERPALFTSTSIGPRLASTSASTGSMAETCVTSSVTACALPPSATMSDATSSSCDFRRATNPTDAPAFASVRAMLFPSPLEAPVTRTVLPARLKRDPRGGIYTG